MINWKKDKNGYYKKGNDSKLYYTVEKKQCYDPENDIYNLLEVDSTASIEEIKKVYDRIKNVLENKIKNGNTFLEKTLDDYDNAWNIIKDDRLRNHYDEHRFKCNSKGSNKIVNYIVKIEQYYDPNYDYCDIFNIKSNTKDDDIMKKFDDAIASLEKNSEGLPNTLTDYTLTQYYAGWDIFKDPQLRKAYLKARSDYKKYYSTKKRTNSTRGTKVTKVESSDFVSKLKNVGIGIAVGLTVPAIIALIIWSYNKIFNKQADNDKEDLKIKKNKATIEHIIEDEDLNNEIGIEPDPLYNVNYFDDINDEEKIHARAVAFYEGLVASNVNNITIEELEDQIRFINGSYYAPTDNDAYNELNMTSQTIDVYGTNIKQATNFAAGNVSENGVHQALHLSDLCLDNSPHADFLDETDILFVNLITSDNEETKHIAAIEYLKQQADLMMGVLVEKNNGTRLNYWDLDDNEGYIYGRMAQISAPVIFATLGKNYVIPYETNNGEIVEVGIMEIFQYYNPQCDEEYDLNNLFAQFQNNLVVRSTISKEENQGLTLTPDNKGNN